MASSSIDIHILPTFFFVSSPFHPPYSKFASASNKVLPEEFQDLSPGLLLGCLMENRVPSPEQGTEKTTGPGPITHGPIGRLYEVACPRVEQHPSIASPMTLELVQGLLSIVSAIEAFIIPPIMKRIGPLDFSTGKTLC